ncbi:MAG TPA: flagellar export chaperone FliS [Spirochaetes bacterium]|nr:flagellar export chaperone FliS [Spirochaetota bacterium]
MENDHISSYRETQIKTASRGKLIVLLYDGLVKFLDIALENMPKKKYDIVNINIIKAQDIVAELIMALNMEAGEVSGKLLSIYTFFNTKLIEANVQKDPKAIKFVRDMMCELRDAWGEIAKKSPNPDMNEMKKEGGIDIAG